MMVENERKSVPNSILTSRLRIELFQQNHSGGLAVMVKNNKERLIENFPKTVAHCLSDELWFSYIRQIINDRENSSAYWYVLYYKNWLAGVIMVKNIDWRVPKCELGYFLCSRFENIGLITEGLGAIIRACFLNLKMHKIFLRILPHNVSSRRVAEKLGFTYEATLKDDFRSGFGEITDIDFYYLFDNHAVV